MSTTTTTTPYVGQTYEQDPRWTAVDHYTLSHLHPPTSSPHASALQHAAALAASRGLPDIAVSPSQGAFLALQARLLRAERVLEVGTLGGYSTIWLAATSPSIKVTTVEVNGAHAACAREAIEAAGLGERVEIVVGAGVDVLPRLRREVEEGRRGRFDFVFVDADKENNLNYLRECIPMARQGACIIVDNVVRKGSLADEEKAKTDSRVQGARAVVEGAGKDDRVEGVVMQTVGEKNYDGFLILSVK